MRGLRAWLLGPVLALAVFGLVPLLQRYGEHRSHALLGPFDLYTFLIQHEGEFVLIFPLMAALPYAVHFSGKVSGRFLTYTRTRGPIRATIARELARGASLTAAVFFVLGVLPMLYIAWRGGHYDWEAYLLETAEQANAYELGFRTFGQLLRFGIWAPVLAYSSWLAVNAALYAVLAMCAALVVRSRVLALSLPWIFYLICFVGMGLLWLEGYSLALVYPFNLTQLPLTNLLWPLAGLTAVVASSATVVLVRAPSLGLLQ